ncbi:MAG: hypothetical protein AAF289_10170 [Cyanobacteria bacterium P01_A01_bin.135]
MSNGSDSGGRGPLLKIVNVAIALSGIGILVGHMLYLIIASFAFSPGAGIQSIMANLIPPLAITYIAFFTDAFKSPYRVGIPRLNIYVISTLWALIVFTIFGNLFDPEAIFSVPWVELLFSFTLVIMITLYRGMSKQAYLAACYGIITAFFTHVVFL